MPDVPIDFIQNFIGYIYQTGQPFFNSLINWVWVMIGISTAFIIALGFMEWIKNWWNGPDEDEDNCDKTINFVHSYQGIPVEKLIRHEYKKAPYDAGEINPATWKINQKPNTAADMNKLYPTWTYKK